MVKIRTAEPRDAGFLAWVILEATRSHVEKGWFDIVLDCPEQECLDFLQRLVMTETRSWWHWSRFHIAEVDDNAAAALCAFRAGESYPLSGAAIGEVCVDMGWNEAKQQAMGERGSYIYKCIFEDGEDFWTIENVATLPSCRGRGRGLAGRLVEHVLPEGRRLGLSTAQIMFSIGNEAAANAYAKAGFVFDSERRHPGFEAATGIPGICRYLKRL